MKVLYVNGQNAKYFDSENKKKPVFAEYFSSTCPACVAMETDWEDMCKDIDRNYNTDLMIAQIDPQGMNGLENMDTYSDVQYVPALILLKNGKKVDEYNGPKKKEDLIKFLMKGGFIKPKYVGGGRRIKKMSSGKKHANKSKKGRKTHKRKPKRKPRRKTIRK